MNRALKAMAVLMLIMVFAVSCTKPENSINSVSISGNFGDHDYVDLGLPSGTMWATCNVGANLPEDYGDYYAWGERYRKIDFYWENYKFGMYGREKYCKDDGLLVLEAEDDVVQCRWHFGWCMPTKAQWEELIRNTSSIVTTLNGVQGRLFTASNGNSLFLPATGLIESEDPHFGNYWSNTVAVDELEETSWTRAWEFWFDGNQYHLSAFDRCFGFTIRPVHPAE